MQRQTSTNQRDAPGQDFGSWVGFDMWTEGGWLASQGLDQVPEQVSAEHSIPANKDAGCGRVVPPAAPPPTPPPQNPCLLRRRLAATSRWVSGCSRGLYAYFT
jgi:hypothetical protein